MQWLLLVLSLLIARVTFEVMLAGFGLEQPALKRIGAIVQVPRVPTACSRRKRAVSGACWGRRDAIDANDQLVEAAGTMFDAVLASLETKRRLKRTDLHLAELDHTRCVLQRDRAAR
jgi:hypothetical protein